MTMPKFLILSYEKMFPCPKVIPDKTTCATWELEIKQTTQSTFTGSKSNIPNPEDHEYYSKALGLPWKHMVHKYWLEEIFRRKTNRWPTWEQIILLGYQSALLTKRLVNSEVLK